MTDSGASYFFVNSRYEASNGERVRWGLQTYSWITVHELLYRTSAASFFQSARATAESLVLQESKANQDVQSLHIRLQQFLVYADIVRSGQWQTMRDYHLMASRALGGAAATNRLRQTLTDFQQAITSQQQTIEMGKLVELQTGLGWLEVIFLAYYSLSIMEHVGHALHFRPAVVTGGVAFGLVLAVVQGVALVRHRHITRQIVVGFFVVFLLWLVFGYLTVEHAPLLDL